MDFGLSVMITIIVALCSVVCPLVTCHMANRHDTKIREMEYERKLVEDRYYHLRNIYEEYLKNAGCVMTVPDTEPFSGYGESYLLALMHSPKSLQDKMIKADRVIQDKDWNGARPLLEDLTHDIQNKLQSMYI